MRYQKFILYLEILLLQSLQTTTLGVNISSFNVVPCKVPLFAETDVSETNFLFGVLLSQIHGCGCRLDWRKRGDYINKYADTQQILGPLVLVATGGPNREEQESFLRIPQGQEIILLHPSDETISQTNPAIYGEVKVIMRNYYHAQLDDSTMDYLVSDSENTTNHSKLLWMPLGLANLKPLPKALRRDFLGRPYLWSWAGSTGSKPERSEMLEALNNHASTARITQLGALHTFNSYAGRPIGSQDSMTVWEYSVLLHNTQFLPVPAGISAEQFRVWEAFEAGRTLAKAHFWLQVITVTFCLVICQNGLPQS
jgi:hypothetical protein